MNEQTLFTEALERTDPRERAAFLDHACRGDAVLRARIDRLLAQHEHAGHFLEAPPLAPQPTVEEPAGEHPGEMIGPYKLVEQIGEGGMGTVWMAQQQEPVKRLVAIKLIKAGMDSKQVVARFEAERQALALMDHANIARVLDAGATSTGRPYFVMDLVRGMPITYYCDEQHLTPRQRLELFVLVCQAVQHAHQKGVIHRDLKPSNVLVALYDGRPVPKIIDFGVAKAAGQILTEKTLVTSFGAIVGTLEYMSPEQAEINQLDIDTRSDIYSLGVLLYELLAGSPPFKREELEKAGVLEMLRLIREQEPTRPSAKLSTAQGLPALAVNRGTEPAKLARLIRGELDWIVMKTLEKDRNRRYETADALALDVQRYLQDEQVLACPPSRWYRLGKFARRNRAMLAPLGAIAALFVLGAALLAVSNARLEREQQATKRALASETKAKNDLQDALERQQRDQARLHVALANSLSMVGDVDEAKQHLEEVAPRFRDLEWRKVHRACYAELLRLSLDDVGVRKVCYSHDGRWIAAVDYVARLRVWDATTGQCRHTLRVTDRPLDMAFSDDDKFVIVAGGRGVRRDPNSAGTVVFPRMECQRWELDGGKVLGGFSLPLNSEPQFLSSDGRRLAGLSEGDLHVWDTSTGDRLFLLTPPQGDMLRAMTWSRARNSLAFTKDLPNLVTFCDSDTGQVKETINLVNGVLSYWMAISPDGRRLAGPARAANPK
ncbi:MAG TPA: WD40 repeat domain-containing serine/threonine protein kinase, partial [Pirellulales bacterium]|nr:WD40 repeat domain-containing serine/threonine protein kinase [Pirellulales bacterium]